MSCWIGSNRQAVGRPARRLSLGLRWHLLAVVFGFRWAYHLMGGIGGVAFMFSFNASTER